MKCDVKKVKKGYHGCGIVRDIALECGIPGSDADATEPNLIEEKSFRALLEAQRLDIADRISMMGRTDVVVGVGCEGGILEDDIIQHYVIKYHLVL
ncbi:hypothetical protein Tco_1077153 [Tanacetum coccineum]